ncbi:retrotransposable element [Pimephales promelas]|nr:retrotransposable element [Pimephales promelas]
MEGAFGLKPPANFDWNATCIPKAWKAWEEEFSLYMDLSLTDADNKTKVKVFQYLIGETGRELCKTLSAALPADGELTIEWLLTAFRNHCNPAPNETVERYKFFSRNQNSSETFDKYVTDLKVLADTCNFGTARDSLIRDRIVCGIMNSHVRERLLRETELTLEKCVRICKASELSKENVMTIEGQKSEVHAVQRVRQAQSAKQTQPAKCKFCGKQHEWKKQSCPAYGKQCRKCGKMNHFTSTCKTKETMRKGIHSVVEREEEELYQEILSLNSQKEDKHDKQLFATMLINERPVKFQLYCGASCNVIPIQLLNPDTVMEKTEQILVMYNKSTLKPIGKCRTKIRNPRNRKLYRLEFMVVDESSSVPLLGNKAVQAMDLVRIQHENIMAIDDIVTTERCSEKLTWDKGDIQREYADVFEGDGCLEGTYNLEVDPEVKPVRLPKRRVPVAIMKHLKDELGSLEERGIIAQVEKSTDWISSMVVVKKPSGKLRICIDPRPLNKALKRQHFPLPTIDDVLPDLTKARVFTVCDVKDGFWHVRLSEESSYLTTFATPFGRYRWIKMPMGISPAPEVFQPRLTQALEGLPGIRIIADDILICGEGDNDETAEKDHDEKLRQLLERCRKRNIKLNFNKLKLKQKEVPYIGHRLTSEGLKIDPEKVRAIVEMPRPADVKGLQRLLGMVNYLSKFCPHLSDSCDTLRQLTHRDAVWEWSGVQEEAFNKVKQTIASAPVLKYYNPEEDLVLQCDSSETGLGAALLQAGQPVAFCSRALTPTEKGYAQIEKECLAILFGMEKFHQYTYGRSTEVHSDHKPLETITRKPLLDAPKRLQRMLLRLQRYDINVVYVPGRLMYLADTLSRAYLPECASEGSVETEIETINMLQYLPISEGSLQKIQTETAKDETFQMLRQVIVQGWPEEKTQLKEEVRPFFSVREELSVQHGVIFRGERAVIPTKLRTEIMERIHAAHLGIESCLRRARDCVYWPGMSAAIRAYIGNCAVCRAVDVRQQKETLCPHVIPMRPWSKVGTDLFSFNNRAYLITVDYFSNFWEVDCLTDTRSSTVIHKLKAHFARHGIPDTVISDNGPQYSSQEFKQFSTVWEFKHITSSPAYPQSNGKAESAVKTAKQLMEKAKRAKTDPYLAILEHRNTPSQGFHASPAQRLMSRRTKTLLPTHDGLLQPGVVNTEHAVKANQRKQAFYYNRGAKDLRPLRQGEHVRVQLDAKNRSDWTPATVLRVANNRSYTVKMENGTVMRKHVK